MEPLLTRIDHVGIAVRDLDAAIAWYERVFGVQLVHEEVNEEQGVREAMLAVGDSHIQLLAPLRPDSPIGKFLESHDEGIQQVAYGVNDIEAASAQLRAIGLRLLYDEPRRGTAGSRINFVHPKDAGGVLVELVQARSDAVTSERAGEERSATTFTPNDSSAGGQET